MQRAGGINPKPSLTQPQVFAPSRNLSRHSFKYILHGLSSHRRPPIVDMQPEAQRIECWPLSPFHLEMLIGTHWASLLKTQVFLHQEALLIVVFSKP